MNNTYPNTAEGALEYLLDYAMLDLKGATVEADPEMSGVWGVSLPFAWKEENFAVVYLRGPLSLDYEVGYRESAEA